MSKPNPETIALVLIIATITFFVAVTFNAINDRAANQCQAADGKVEWR